MKRISQVWFVSFIPSGQGVTQALWPRWCILRPLFPDHRNMVGILPAPLMQLLHDRLNTNISGIIFRQAFLNRWWEIFLCLRRAASLPALFFTSPCISSHSNSTLCISKYYRSVLLRGLLRVERLLNVSVLKSMVYSHYHNFWSASQK